METRVWGLGVQDLGFRCRYHPHIYIYIYVYIYTYTYTPTTFPLFTSPLPPKHQQGEPARPLDDLGREHVLGAKGNKVSGFM